MATTATGLTTSRWSLHLGATPTGAVATWIALHVDPSLLVIPQDVYCVDGKVHGRIVVDQTGIDDVIAETDRTLQAEPPVPVVCLHRWAYSAEMDSPGTSTRTCLECTQVQVLDWVDVVA